MAASLRKVSIDSNPQINPAHKIPRVLIDPSSQRKFKRLKMLGVGGCSTCFKVRDLNTSEFFACKAIYKPALDRAGVRIDQEVRVHEALDNPYIVKFLLHFEDDYFAYLFMEYCENLDLKRLFNGKPVQESSLRLILRQIIFALHYLHAENGILHRDIKLKNIFVSKKMEFKIGDFGSAIGEHDHGQLRGSFAVTDQYAPPEVMSKKPHTFPMDIWSVGVSLFELLTGNLPFDANDRKSLKKKICAVEFSFPPKISVSPEMFMLIKSMLDGDPLKRPTTYEILDDPVLTKCSIPRKLSIREFKKPGQKKTQS